MLPTKSTCARPVFCMVTALGLACVAAVPASAQSRARTVALDPGTVIAVQLNDTLSSTDSKKGDTFSTTVQSSNNAGLPAGTTIQGVVRDARPKNGKNPGVLDLAFDQVVLPNGRKYSINGSVIGLDSKSVTRTSGGRLIANKSHRTNRLTYVGYGAGAGLLLSVITHRKSTLTDTLIGGGLGYLYGALEKGHSVNDVKLSQGTKMGVRLDSRLSYAR